MANKITPLKAIKQHCWECMGHYSDGKVDCENTKCPLYSYMPQAEMEPDLEIFEFNPKRVGKILHSKRLLTPEEIEMLKNRLKSSQKSE